MANKSKDSRWAKFDKVTSEWNPYLSMTESCILVFIYRRTINYKKKVEKIPYRHFLQGVYTTEEKKLIQGRLNIGKTTLVRNLNSLEKKGIIKVDRTGEKNKYQINFDWKPDVKKKMIESKNIKNEHEKGIFLKSTTRINGNSHNIDKNFLFPNGTMLVPKRNISSATKEQQLYQNGTALVPNRNNITYNNKERFLIEEKKINEVNRSNPKTRKNLDNDFQNFKNNFANAKLSQKTRIIAPAAQVQQVSISNEKNDLKIDKTEKQLQRQLVNKQRIATKKRIIDFWEEKVKECFPSMKIIISSYEKANGQAGLLFKKWTDGGNKPEELFDLISWSIKKWIIIMENRYHWMFKPKPPEYPHIGFFLSHFAEFSECYFTGISVVKSVGEKMADRMRDVGKIDHTKHKELINPTSLFSKMDALKALQKQRDKLGKELDMVSNIEARKKANVSKLEMKYYLLKKRIDELGLIEEKCNDGNITAEEKEEFKFEVNKIFELTPDEWIEQQMKNEQKST